MRPQPQFSIRGVVNPKQVTSGHLRETTGCETTGRETTGCETTDRETTDRETTGRETTDHETTGRETTGRGADQRHQVLSSPMRQVVRASMRSRYCRALAACCK